MERFTIERPTRCPLAGARRTAIVGVVASGNLEILAERDDDPGRCTVAVETASEGFEAVWRAVIADFAERISPGGVRFSVNDGGARPDTVMLRLMQAARTLSDASEER